MPQENRPETASEVLDRYWKIWQVVQPLTMGEIMNDNMKPVTDRLIVSAAKRSIKSARMSGGQRLIWL